MLSQKSLISNVVAVADISNCSVHACLTTLKLQFWLDPMLELLFNINKEAHIELHFKFLF